MKLIGIDLDGTLLNSRQKISEKNIAALKEISKSAVPFICSGREVKDIQNILEQAGLSIPAVGLNGAVGYDGDQKLFEFCFDPASVKAIGALVLDFPTKLYTNHGSYESPAYQEKLKEVFKKIGGEFSVDQLNYELEYEKSIQSMPFDKIEEVVELEETRVYKTFIFIPNRVIKSAVKKSLEALNGISITESSAVNLEIVPHGVSKGRVYQLLEEIYGLGATTKFAIGDSLNDLSLFEHANIGFSMENGHPSIKDIADYITASNDNDGVAEALKMISVL